MHENRWTATELLERLQGGQLRAVELLEQYLERIDRLDGRVGAFLHVDRQAAREQAEAVDRARREGRPLGPLAGVPVALKDNLCTSAQPTTCASRMLEHFKPPYDATVVRKLREAGAILIGKTNLDEFAMGSSTENSSLGSTRNPWDLERVPGGSSGGSAACVSAGLAPLALGSDTGGSIRQPAAFCGVVGLKPTYGRVSRYGLVAFASSLDQIGPLAASVEDTALVLSVIAGHDPKDSTSAPLPVPDYLEATRLPVDGLRLGVVRELFGAGVDPALANAVQEAIRVLESLGATVRDVALPHCRYATAAYYVVAPCEASSNLARYDGVHYGMRYDERKMAEELESERAALLAAGRDPDEELESPLVRMYRRTRSAGFGAEVKRRIMLGTYALSAGYYDAYYLKALKARRLIRQDYDRAFEQVDVLVGPTTPTAAFRIGEKVQDPIAMYTGDLCTVGANLAGVPALSLPCGMTADGLPVGLHLQAPPFHEARLLQLGAAYQKKTDWHRLRPPLG